MLVPTVRTICTQQELIKALIKSWQDLFQNTPSKASICIILAQHQIETGNYACWNWNLCNVKYVAFNGDVDYCALKGVWEIINGVRVELPPENPGSWFRSFKSLAEGSDFYLKFLSNGRYKAAWDAVIEGNPQKFSHLLKVAGFYTADEATYTRAVAAYFNKFMQDSTYDKIVENPKIINIWSRVGNILFGRK